MNTKGSRILRPISTTETTVVRNVKCIAPLLHFVIALALGITAAAPSKAGSTDDVPGPSVRPTAAVVGEAADSKPIQDNSFLIEEAYNQEEGVVQHIQSLTRYSGTGDWVYSFTQEWPGWVDAHHQLSYTLLALTANAIPGTRVGLGDAMLNYRYQLVGNGDTRIAFAPRVSAMVPLGNSRVGRGFGGWGVQTNLPLSVVLSRRLVTHWNAGATLVPRMKNAAGETGFSSGYSLGQSVVWLAHPRFNVLCETMWNSMGTVTGPSRTSPVRSLYVSPGIRWAYNIGHLQVVPGIAVPLGAGPSAGDRGIFLYLSIEHPFRKIPQKEHQPTVRP